MLSLPKDLVMDIYEQVFYELLEIREMYTANEMLTKCEPLASIKFEKEERYVFNQNCHHYCIFME